MNRGLPRLARGFIRGSVAALLLLGALSAAHAQFPGRTAPMARPRLPPSPDPRNGEPINPRPPDFSMPGFIGSANTGNTTGANGNTGATGNSGASGISGISGQGGGAGGLGGSGISGLGGGLGGVGGGGAGGGGIGGTGLGGRGMGGGGLGGLGGGKQFGFGGGSFSTFANQRTSKPLLSGAATVDTIRGLPAAQPEGDTSDPAALNRPRKSQQRRRLAPRLPI